LRRRCLRVEEELIALSGEIRGVRNEFLKGSISVEEYFRVRFELEARYRSEAERALRRLVVGNS